MRIVRWLGKTVGFQDPHRFQHHRTSGRIVCSACSGVPRIEVRTEHHDFGCFVGAGNFANDVERIQILVVELVLDVQFHRHGHIVFQIAVHESVVLDRNHDLWIGTGGALTAGSPPPCTVTLPPVALPCSITARTPSSRKNWFRCCSVRFGWPRTALAACATLPAGHLHVAPVDCSWSVAVHR